MMLSPFQSAGAADSRIVCPYQKIQPFGLQTVASIDAHTPPALHYHRHALVTVPVDGCLPVCMSAVDFELNLCDVQPGVLGGAQEEFLYVGRLDNLGSCYTALEVIYTKLGFVHTQRRTGFACGT